MTEKFLPLLRPTQGRATCVALATKRVDGKTLLDSSRDTLAGTTPRAEGNLCRTPLRPYCGRLQHLNLLPAKQFTRREVVWSHLCCSASLIDAPLEQLLAAGLVHLCPR